MNFINENMNQLILIEITSFNIMKISFSTILFGTFPRFLISFSHLPTFLNYLEPCLTLNEENSLEGCSQDN